MQFNPTDKENSLIADVDFLLFGSSTFNSIYSLVDRTRNMNIAYDEIVADLYKADPNYKWDDANNEDYPIAKTDLVANKDNYMLLDSSQVVHRVRVLDPNGEWKTLKAKARSSFTDDELSATGGTPEHYFKLGNGVFILPVPDYGATKGFELEFQRAGSRFTISDTTKTPGFSVQFHQLLSIKTALRYAKSKGLKDKVEMLTGMELEMSKKMLDFYQTRSLDEKPSFKLKRNVNFYGLN